MTILVFVGSLLLAMAMGIPIAFSLLASGVALMWHLDLFDAQILAQNVIGGADSFPGSPGKFARIENAGVLHSNENSAPSFGRKPL